MKIPVLSEQVFFILRFFMQSVQSSLPNLRIIQVKMLIAFGAKLRFREWTCPLFPRLQSQT